ncbi:unnamed protein product [Arctogadus glacialis]
MEDTIRRPILTRLLSNDFEFTCRQELCNAPSRHVDVPTYIVQALEQHTGRVQPDTVPGEVGRPRFDIDRECLEEVLEINLPVPCIAKMLDEDDKVDEEEMHFKSRCEKCQASQQSPEYEKVTPTKISKWNYEVQLEGEGTYECSATGLVFEVSEQALVRYSVLSWFQFSEFLGDSWRPAGSIYDVDVVNKDPSVLKFIHFPHSLCLAEPELELSFSVLHVKDRHANIEPTVDFTASHVKWRVSSLSLLAPIIPESQKMKHHALVLIYKELNKYHENQFVFHVFLASNYNSEIKAIEEQVLKSRKKCIKIYKPAACRLEEKFYHLTSEPERKIEPPVFVGLPFILSVILCNTERESIVSNFVCVCTETRIRH